MFTVLDPRAPAIREALERPWYDAGRAAIELIKAGGTPESIYGLKGRLYLSESGWLLLGIPNPLVRGLFSMLDVPGAELPLRDGKLNAHVSVMTAAEVAKIGPDSINERGKLFAFQLGPLQEVRPAGWKGVAKAYLVRIISPELKRLRQSYALPPLPNGHEFHCTIGLKKQGVTGNNPVSKAAAAGDFTCPECGHREQPDGPDPYVRCPACRAEFEPAIKVARPLAPKEASAWSQLPGFHLPETLVGAGVGAAAGGLVGALRGPTDEKSRGRRALEHALAGAAVGGVAGDVAEDRARRYVSNSMPAWAYDAPDGVGALKPKSLRHVWDAAVLDKPTYLSGSAPKFVASLDAPGSGYNAYAKETLRDQYLPARRELLRRVLGVHTPDAKRDFWAPRGDGTMGVNPAKAGLQETLRRFAGRVDGPLDDMDLAHPERLVAEANRSNGGPLLGDAATGRQQLRPAGGPGHAVAATDPWNFDLHPREQDAFDAGLRGLGKGRLPGGGWLGLLGRQALEHAGGERPVIRQPMRFEPDPAADWKDQVQFLGPGDAPLGPPVKAGALCRALGLPAGPPP